MFEFFSKRYRYLLFQLVKREVTTRYKTSALGLVWAVILPLAMLAVYTFVFQGVFKARWPGQEMSADFPLNVFCGLIVFTLFSETIGRAPGLVAEQPNLVKKVVFPIELLVWVNVLNALFYALISLTVLVLGVFFIKQTISFEILLLIPILAVFSIFLAGATLLLSALGVYFPDLRHLVIVIMTPLLFLSPVFYPVSAMPELVQPVIAFNPLTHIIESVRLAVISEKPVDFSPLLYYSIASVGLWFVGSKVFRALKKGFADVI